MSRAFRQPECDGVCSDQWGAERHSEEAGITKVKLAFVCSASCIYCSLYVTLSRQELQSKDELLLQNSADIQRHKSFE